MMDNSAFLFQNPVVVLREEFDDWAVLYNPDSASAVGINPIGVFIWKTVDGAHNRAEIVRLVLDAHDQVTENAVQEVGQYIDQLVEGGFLGCQAPEPG